MKDRPTIVGWESGEHLVTEHLRVHQRAQRVEMHAAIQERMGQDAESVGIG
jgi:hypothetical protein